MPLTEIIHDKLASHKDWQAAFPDNRCVAISVYDVTTKQSKGKFRSIPGPSADVLFALVHLVDHQGHDGQSHRDAMVKSLNLNQECIRQWLQETLEECSISGVRGNDKTPDSSGEKKLAEEGVLQLRLSRADKVKGVWPDMIPNFEPNSGNIIYVFSTTLLTTMGKLFLLPSAETVSLETEDVVGISHTLVRRAKSICDSKVIVRWLNEQIPVVVQEQMKQNNPPVVTDGNGKRTVILQNEHHAQRFRESNERKRQRVDPGAYSDPKDEIACSKGSTCSTVDNEMGDDDKTEIPLEQSSESLEIVEALNLESSDLDTFRDMRTKDNKAVERDLADDTIEEVVYVEGGSTIEKALEFDEEMSSSSALTVKKPTVIVRELLLKRSQYESHRESIIKKAKKQFQDEKIRIKVVIASSFILRQVLDSKKLGPCTILAVAQKPQNVPFFVPSTSNGRIPRKLVVLDGLTNADNVGSIIRTAACSGAEGIILSKHCCGPWSRRAIRISMGHVFGIPIFIENEEYPMKKIFSLFKSAYPNSKSFASVVQNNDIWAHQVCRETFGISAKTFGTDKTRDDHGHGYILVMGAEHDGVTEKVRKLCDYRITIRMPPSCDSFNVFVAAGILLHQFETAMEE